jgi:formyltetrahydrofolate synthetase
MGLELHKTYKVSELYNIFGSDWANILKLKSIPKVFNKPVINTFNDFDEDTKQKYILIAKAIKEANGEIDINVWATGSRIDGSWKTTEEAEELAKKYNRIKPKYSDYDFITDAAIIPNLESLGFPCHGYQTPFIQHKVQIPKESYF